MKKSVLVVLILLTAVVSSLAECNRSICQISTTPQTDTTHSFTETSRSEPLQESTWRIAGARVNGLTTPQYMSMDYTDRNG
ncbi:MAG: hypothetical protein PHD88_05495 [Firmicutes bacterium]|nr:hypothetical protein [Bacillota bacterium]